MNREASLKKYNILKDTINFFIGDKILISTLSPYQISQIIKISVFTRNEYLKLPKMYRSNLENYLNQKIIEVKS